LTGSGNFTPAVAKDRPPRARERLQQFRGIALPCERDGLAVIANVGRRREHGYVQRRRLEQFGLRALDPLPGLRDLAIDCGLRVVEGRCWLRRGAAGQRGNGQSSDEERT